jgi:hypothetical protein
MTWLKEHILIMLTSLGVFITPVQPFFLLLSLMVTYEYLLRYTLFKSKVKGFEGHFEVWEPVVKIFGYLLIIFIGLIADDAFKFKTSNFPMLSRYGFPQAISPIAFCLCLALTIGEGQDIDRLVKKKYGRSLVDTLTKVFPKIIDVASKFVKKK